MKRLTIIFLLLTPALTWAQGTVVRSAPVSSNPAASNYNKQVLTDANLGVVLTFSIPVVTTPTFNNANPRVGALVFATQDSSIYVWSGHSWLKSGQGGGGSGDTVSFTSNFKNLGTVTNAIIDLADTLRVKNSIGVKTDTPRYPLDVAGNIGIRAGLRILNIDTIDGRATIEFEAMKGGLQKFEIGINAAGVGSGDYVLRNVSKIAPPFYDFIFKVDKATDVFTHFSSVVLKNHKTAATADSVVAIRNDTLVVVPFSGGGSKFVDTLTNQTIYGRKLFKNTTTLDSAYVVGHFNVTGALSQLDINDADFNFRGVNADFKDDASLPLLHLGNGSTAALSFATHLQVTNQPSFPNDVTRLRDVDSLITASGGGTTYSAGNNLVLTGTVFKADTTAGHLATKAYVDNFLTKASGASTYALQATTISPGNGLSGGGSLAANRILTADTSILAPKNYVNNFGTKAFNLSTYVPLTRTVAGFALSSNVSLAALTATNTTLTFSGSYDGSTARTVGLNLSNANTWAALQTFGTNISVGGVTPTGAIGTGNFVLSISPTFTGTIQASALNMSGALSIAGNALGATTSLRNYVNNQTAATVGTQSQWSPAFLAGGNAWNTSSANNKIVQFQWYTKPVAGNPVSGLWMLDGTIDGTTFINAMSVSTGGIINVPGLTASKVVFTDASKNLTSTGIGTSSQFIMGDGSLGTIGARPHTIFTPTTGGTVALTNNQYNIINPAGALLALTVNLPSSPANNDCVFIKFTQNVTTVTYGNGTVVDGIVGPVPGTLVVLVYDLSSTSWY